MVPHCVVPTAPAEGDRWIAIACETEGQWHNLAGLMGREDLQFLDLDQRLGRREEMESLLAEWTAAQDASQLEAMLQAVGVPAHQVQNSTECVADPQLRHREQFRNVPHPIHGDSWVEGPAFTMSRSDGGPTWAGPTLGQHTFEILSELFGYDADRIADIAAAGCLE